MLIMLNKTQFSNLCQIYNNIKLHEKVYNIRQLINVKNDISSLLLNVYVLCKIYHACYILDNMKIYFSSSRLHETYIIILAIREYLDSYRYYLFNSSLLLKSYSDIDRRFVACESIIQVLKYCSVTMSLFTGFTLPLHSECITKIYFF